MMRVRKKAGWRGAVALLALLLQFAAFGGHAAIPTYGGAADGPRSARALAAALGEICAPGRPDAPRRGEEPAHPPAVDDCQSCGLCLAGGLPVASASVGGEPHGREASAPFPPSPPKVADATRRPPARGPPRTPPTERPRPPVPFASG